MTSLNVATIFIRHVLLLLVFSGTQSAHCSLPAVSVFHAKNTSNSSVTIRCESHSPTQWLWNVQDELVMKSPWRIDKYRKQYGEEELLVSDLIFSNVSETNWTMNFSCWSSTSSSINFPSIDMSAEEVACISVTRFPQQPDIHVSIVNNTSMSNCIPSIPPHSSHTGSVPRTNFVLLAVASVGTIGIITALVVKSCRKDASTDKVKVLKFKNRNSKKGSGTVKLKFGSNLKIPRIDTSSEFCSVLGHGHFATVYKTVVNEKWTAVKIPHKILNQESMEMVLRELKILHFVGGNHPNVLALVGVYLKEVHRGLIQIATELCENGSLLSYLHKLKKDYNNAEVEGEREREPLDRYELTRISAEIASGMEYLSEKNVIHGDLSTRNVFLGEAFVCKIGDFGLSRKLYEYHRYVKTAQEPMPWRWMAIESLASMEFSSKSDVWSYGITLWEIYSLGDLPYPGVAWSDGFFNEIKAGLRLTIPTIADESIYGKMTECWNIQPSLRPTFNHLTTFFRQMMGEQYVCLD